MGYHSVFILSDGTVKACGWNSQGQLGDDTIMDRSTPILVLGLSGVKQVSEGIRHTLFLLNDGTVKVCGDNEYGQLGDGSTTNRSTPVFVPGLSGVKQVSGGDWHTVFLLNDGTVKACGDNRYGQLGDATITNKSSVLVPSLSGVKQVSIGRQQTFFLLSDGTVKTCGYNAYGQSGVGTTTPISTPTLVPDLSGVKQVYAGPLHTVFLLNDGTVKTCGYNSCGQLGYNTTMDRGTPTPTLVPGLSEVKQVSLGTEHTLFLLNDGTVKACGDSKNGQLGRSGTITTPTLVPGLSGVKQVHAGAFHSLFLLNDGTVKACGSNSYGQLGDGTTMDRSTLLLVPGLSQVAALPDMLLEDTPVIPKSKYLILSAANAAMTYSDKWHQVAENWTTLTENQKLDCFTSKGMTVIPDSAALSQLGKYQILRYTDNSAAAAVQLNLTAVPKDKLVLAAGDIDISRFTQLKQINPVCNAAGNGLVKIILSADGGTTWKTWDGGSWVSVEPTVEAVKQSGMLPATVATVTADNLAALLGTSKIIRIGYLLSMNGAADIANSDRLDIVGLQLGAWEHAIPGQDFTSRFINNETLQVTITHNTSTLAGGKTDFKINHPV